MNDNSNSFGETNGPTSYYNTSSNARTNSIENSYASIQVIPVPQSEQGLEIYSLLEKNCDLFFCKNKKVKEFLFSCKTHFFIFATNYKGGLYGTIGGIGDIQDDNYPIGYVSNDGRCGKIANNLREFLQLIVFYPFWLDLLNCPEKERQQTAELLEKQRLESIPNYLENQQKIANTFHIQKRKDTIEILFSNLKQEHCFVVYATNKQHVQYENLL